jgi:hypothetical protein
MLSKNDSSALIRTTAFATSSGFFAALTSITVTRPERCWITEQSPSFTFKKWILGMHSPHG